MPNPYFRFKQFTVFHHQSGMKVTTDACLFGAWCAEKINNSNHKVQNALDIGTGTGLLALMIAQKNEIHIDAVELEEGASKQAVENVAASPWKDNIKVYRSDILHFPFTASYDCIISNPPFYEKEILPKDANKILAHHGSSLTIRQLLLLIRKGLHEAGAFYLLLPYKRIKQIEAELIKTHLFISEKVSVAPSVQHPPFRMLLKGGKQPATVQNTELFICNERQQYTPDFIHFLKDYYLYL